MKKLTLILICLCLIAISTSAQDSNAKAERINKLNQQIVENFKARDFKQAQELGHEALELTLEAFGPQSLETANSHLNLGEIYVARKKYADASSHFRRSLEIFRLKPTENQKKVLRVLDSLTVTLTLDKKEVEAASIVEDLLSSATAALGAESKEILPYLITAKSFYVYTKNFEKAESLFAEQYRITRAVFGADSAEVENVNDDFECYSLRFKPDERLKKSVAFFDAVRTDVQPKPIGDLRKINGGVVNGKAISLPIPDYPASSKARGSRGTVNVKILIDETGKVIFAKAICSDDQDIKRASEEAAMKAKFRPTTLEGKAVQVAGTVVYVFN
jgi:TonB family protein